MATKLLPFGVTLGISVLTGGFILGQNADRLTTLCEEMDGLKRDHEILKEKVYDTHTKVCVINEKINNFLSKKG